MIRCRLGSRADDLLIVIVCTWYLVNSAKAVVIMLVL